MKKVICAVISIILVLSLSACVVYTPDDASKNPNIEKNDSTSSETVSPSETEKQEEAIIIDNEQMKVTYQKVVDGADLGVSGVFYLWLKIENKTDVEVVASLTDADVDGESVSMVMTGVPLKIRPDNSGTTGFIFTTSQLSIDSVDDVQKVTFKVSLRNAESYDVIYESDFVTVVVH